jgi:hypothetical protein
MKLPIAMYFDELKEVMMQTTIRLLDVVALTEDLPEHNLSRGQVGTVVEELAPDVFEVEFCDNNGRTYAMLALRTDQLMLLHYEPALAT